MTIINHSNGKISLLRELSIKLAAVIYRKEKFISLASEKAPQTFSKFK